MIFRKPYAFLIKYFKLINIILSVLSFYVVYKLYNITNVFNEYISNNYSGNYYQGFYDEYINPFLYLAIILIFIGLFFIIVLFINKKKPTKMYISIVLYNVIIIIYLSLVKNTMVTMASTIITAETARAFRDLSLIAILPEIYFIILLLMRGLGVNIKQFNFEKDVKEFEVMASDNEEVELFFKNDGVKLKRGIRRFFREFVYYVKENIIIISLLVVLLTIASVFLIYKSFPEIIDKNYKQGDIIVNNNIKYNISDSIITNLDYNGKEITDTYYLVIKLILENTKSEAITVDYNEYTLLDGDNLIYPSKDKSANFIDYASNCTVNVIKANSKETCALAYELKSKDIKDSYKIKRQNGNVYSNGIKNARYDYITITPAILNEIKIENIVNLNEEINFQNSNLGNSILKVKNYQINNKYIYNYEFCTDNKECLTYKDIVNAKQSNTTLLILDYEYTTNNNDKYVYTSNINKIFDTFVKIKYIKNDDIKYINIKNVTPKNLKNKIVLEVSNEINNLDSYYLSFIIRNKEYLLKIK